MDYIAYPENRHVMSNVTRGSNVAEYEPRLIQLHAVACDDEGKIQAQTVCGRLSVRFPPEQVEHKPWEQTNYSSRCLDCARATGVMAVNSDTGEGVPGRR